MKQNNAIKKIRKFSSRVKEVSKEKGIYYVIRAGIKIIINRITNYFWYHYYTKIKSKQTFVFQGRMYHYFYHRYNNTWENERAVEIPIIWHIVKENRGKKILEVGNVLSHYFRVNYDIVDKYEKVEGVINEDIVNFQPSKKYDLIISISTLEHVGWDENPREPDKILKAIEHLKSLLSPKGKIIVTLPLGYNPKMDRFLKEGWIKFDKLYCLKRITKDNKWIETNWNDICDAKYGRPFPNANGLVIGIIEKN